MSVNFGCIAGAAAWKPLKSATSDSSARLPSALLQSAAGLTPFGIIHAGFAALRIVTSELVAFRAFLDGHGGHPLTQWSDTGDEDFGPDGTDTDAKDSRRMKAFRFKHPRYVDGYYELMCVRCSQAFRGSSPGKLLPFDDFSPTRAEVDRFCADVLRGRHDNFHKVGGFPFDDLEGNPTLSRTSPPPPAASAMVRTDRVPRVPVPSHKSSRYRRRVGLLKITRSIWGVSLAGCSRFSQR
jgi:hypothetical protein